MSDARRITRLRWILAAALLSISVGGSAGLIMDQPARWRLTAAERTLRQHASTVYEKSGLGGRAELSAYFLQDLMLPAAERQTVTRMK